MQVGYVTTTPGARPHLALNGLAHCGAGTGRIIGDTTALTAAIAERACKRCRRRMELLATDELHEAQRRRETGRAERANRILEALETPGHRVEVNVLAAAVAARITAVRPIRQALSGFGAMAAAHREAMARDAAERAAGQLTLI